MFVSKKKYRKLKEELKKLQSDLEKLRNDKHANEGKLRNEIRELEEQRMTLRDQLDGNLETIGTHHDNREVQNHGHEVVNSEN